MITIRFSSRVPTGERSRPRTNYTYQKRQAWNEFLFRLVRSSSIGRCTQTSRQGKILIQDWYSRKPQSAVHFIKRPRCLWKMASAFVAVGPSLFWIQIMKSIVDPRGWWICLGLEVTGTQRPVSEYKNTCSIKNRIKGSENIKKYLISLLFIDSSSSSIDCYKHLLTLIGR